MQRSSSGATESEIAEFLQIKSESDRQAMVRFYEQHKEIGQIQECEFIYGKSYLCVKKCESIG